MKGSKEQKIGIGIILVSIVMAAAEYFVLPDTLVVQVGMDGTPSNTLPKLAALLIPLAVSVIFSVLYMNGKERDRTKNLLVALLGIVIYAVMFVMNL